MKITVLMSSGDEDEWDDVFDAVVPEGGSLVVLGEKATPGPGTFEVRENKMSGQTPYVETSHRRLEALYAPGMWMKVQFG